MPPCTSCETCLVRKAGLFRIRLTTDLARNPATRGLSELQLNLARTHVLRRTFAGNRFRQLIDCTCLSSKKGPHLLNGAHQRSGEHYRRVLVDANLNHSLQVAQLRSERVLHHDVRCFPQRGSRKKFSFGSNDRSEEHTSELQSPMYL